MVAMAAEAAGGHAEAFWATPEFWVLIAFVALLALAGRAVLRTITAGLDARADSIRARVADAERLRDEAQELLAAHQRQRAAAAGETEAIVAHARDEAVRLAERAAKDLERSLKRREQLAMERIAQAEATALHEVQNAAIEVALDATRRILATKLSEAKANALIEDAVRELPTKLH